MENIENDAAVTPAPSGLTPQLDQLELVDDSDLFTRLGFLWPRIGEVRAQIKNIIEMKPAERDLLATGDFLKEAWELEGKVEDAIHDVHPVWQYRTILAQDAGKRCDWNRKFRKALVYPNSWIMSMWHAYRITRISLHAALIHCYDVLSSSGHNINTGFAEDLEALRTKSLAIIDSMNEDICASIPWALGKVDSDGGCPANDCPKASKASLSIVGLKAVADGRFARVNQNVEAREALEEIAHVFGIKGAVNRDFAEI